MRAGRSCAPPRSVRWRGCSHSPLTCGARALSSSRPSRHTSSGCEQRPPCCPLSSRAARCGCARKTSSRLAPIRRTTRRTSCSSRAPRTPRATGCTPPSPPRPRSTSRSPTRSSRTTTGGTTAERARSSSHRGWPPLCSSTFWTSPSPTCEEAGPSRRKARIFTEACLRQRSAAGSSPSGDAKCALARIREGEVDAYVREDTSPSLGRARTDLLALFVLISRQ
mmetsp:Transcript_4391/g.10953  ORF Transcript_4391/g.10953 Transcript_4391/m.10953 type:complete len:223 (+) Transcript_4391:246-914(+)